MPPCSQWLCRIRQACAHRLPRWLLSVSPSVSIYPSIYLLCVSLCLSLSLSRSLSRPFPPPLSRSVLCPPLLPTHSSRCTCHTITPARHRRVAYSTPGPPGVIWEPRGWLSNEIYKGTRGTESGTGNRRSAPPIGPCSPTRTRVCQDNQGNGTVIIVPQIATCIVPTIARSDKGTMGPKIVASRLQIDSDPISSSIDPFPSSTSQSKKQVAGKATGKLSLHGLSEAAPSTTIGSRFAFRGFIYRGSCKPLSSSGQGERRRPDCACTIPYDVSDDVARPDCWVTVSLPRV